MKLTAHVIDVYLLPASHTEERVVTGSKKTYYMEKAGCLAVLWEIAPGVFEVKRVSVSMDRAMQELQKLRRA